MPVNKHQLRASPFNIILYTNVYMYYVVELYVDLYLLKKICTYLLTYLLFFEFIVFTSFGSTGGRGGDAKTIVIVS